MALSKNLVVVTGVEVTETLGEIIDVKEFSRSLVEIAAAKSGFDLHSEYPKKVSIADYASSETLNRLADNNMLTPYQVFPVLNHRNEYKTTTSLITGTAEELKKFDNTKVVGWELFSGASGEASLVMEHKPTAYIQWVLQSGDEGNIIHHGSYSSEDEAAEAVLNMCKRKEFIEGIHLSKVEYAEDDTLAGTTFTYRPVEEIVSTMCVTTMEGAPTGKLLEADFYMVSLFTS